MKKSMYTAGLTLLLAMGIHTGSTLAEGTVHEVIIPEGKSVFEPEVITIAVGDTVRWVNKDHSHASHDFVSVPGPLPENKELKVVELKQDETYEHTFNNPGEYKYFCYIHKNMAGMVIVK